MKRVKVFGPARFQDLDCASTGKMAITFCTDVLDGIATMDGDGQNYQVLVPRYAMYPRWSPNGDSIAFRGFFNHREGGNGLFVMTSTGADLRRLEEGNPIIIHWSPNGQYIAWVGASRVNITKVDGTQPTITLPGENVGHGLAWSPNGMEVVYSEDGRTWIFDLASSRKRELPFASHPSWSSQGDLAYAVSMFQLKSDRQSPAPGVYVMHKGKSDLHLDAEASFLSWSPDGNRLAFVGTQSGLLRTKEGLFVADKQMNTIELVIPSHELKYFEPSWSADSSQIIVRGLHQSGSNDFYIYAYTL